MKKKQVSRRVEKMWREFEHVTLKGASAIQRSEMRKAFYAGAASLLVHLKTGIDEGTSEDEGVAVFQSIEEECRQFFEQVVR